MRLHGKVYRWTRVHLPEPWAYSVSRGHSLVAQGYATTWRLAFDRAMQIIRTEEES